jgi:hypothetical protein
MINEWKDGDIKETNKYLKNNKGIKEVSEEGKKEVKNEGYRFG